MADSILRLKVSSEEYDKKLKQATNELSRYVDQCRKVGGTLEVVEKETLEYVRAIGQMDTTSRTATGKLSEMKKAFVELSAQYKQMTDAEKASPFGKALSESLDKLKPRIIDAKNQLDEINKSMIGVSSGGGGLFSGLGDKMSGAIQVFAGNMLTKAAGAVAELGSEIFASVQQGIELARQGEGIRIAFERLGRGDILEGLRQATHGTVTDLELMKAAVKFNDFKLPLDELGTMLAFAQQKAKDTGQSVDYMVDSIVTGLGRKSLMILDNLGLSASEIKDKMAETGDMTKAVGAIIREQMSKAGDYVETAADRAAKADVELKNAMEELGRTFQPLTDASDSLWNSIKVGALNALNTAVKPLIQALSEAGTLGQSARSSAGFNNLGGNTKVDRMISRLGNGKSAGAYSIYQQQLGEFDKFINNKRFQIAAFGGDNSSVAKSAKAKLQTELDGALKMREEYVKRAQELSKPVDVKIETKGAEQNVESLKVKLIELEAQRKKAIAAGDTDLSKNLATQISQVKSDIKGLGGTTTTTTTTHKATPQEKADETYKKAQQDYQQALAQAALEVKAGTINSADAKKKELQAAESLWKSIGDARETYDSPNLKNAQAKVEQDIIRLGGEVTKAVEAQKRSEQAARELETAQKKLADAQSRLAEAQKSGNLKDIYAADKNVTTAQKEVTRLETIKVNVEKGTVDLPDIPKEVEQIVSTKVGNVITPEVATDIVQTISTRLGNIVTPEIAEQLTQTINTKLGEVVTPDVAKELTQVVNVVPGTVELPDMQKEQEVKIVANTDNISAQIAHLKENLGGLEIGSLDFNMTQANLVDMTTLQSIVNEQMKAGLKIDPDVVNDMFSKITIGFDIDDSTWQELVDKINEKLKELNIEPIEINFETGNVKEDGEKAKKTWQAAAGAVSSVGSALNNIEDPSVKAAGMVMQAIASIALGFATASAQANTAGTGWGWLAWLAAGAAAMATTISTVHSLTGYANGGIVKGNSYSGDNIGAMVDGSQMVGLNAGELVLTKSQQNSLAQQLSGNGMANINVIGRISGTDILLSADRAAQASGRGQLVAWK